MSNYTNQPNELLILHLLLLPMQRKSICICLLGKKGCVCYTVRIQIILKYLMDYGLDSVSFAGKVGGVGLFR